MKNLFLLIVLVCALPHVYSQSAVKVDIDSLSDQVKSNALEISNLKKIKFTGFIQFQYQKSDSTGIETFQGDNFEAGQDQRFNIRKGRFKAVYSDNFGLYSVMFDFNEKGVGIKEAFIQIKLPVLRIISVQAGLFNRPFGYEIGYSSSSMEYIERARITQTLFPGETDLGTSVIFHIPNAGILSNFSLQAGLFNGAYNKPDIDNYKDLITNLKYSFSKNDLKVGLGVSYYNGKMANFSRLYYKFVDSMYQSYVIDTLSAIKREYYGIDAQISTHTVLGKTSFSAEYLWGQQPGISKSTRTPIETTLKNSPIGPTYLRQFSGGYLVMVQSILNTNHHLVFRYDWYDPNTKIKGKEIKDKTTSGSATNISKADILYKTFEIGWFYEYKKNTRISIYYDVPINEETSLNEFYADKKDNLFTIRLQYKF